MQAHAQHEETRAAVEAAGLRIEQMGETFGARILGADLRGADEATLRAVHRAWLDYHLVSVPGQTLEQADFVRFSRAMGPLEQHRARHWHTLEAPEIMVLSNVKKDDGKPKGLADAGTYWHSDSTFNAEPSRGTVLYGVQIPAEGGDTLFADMEAAWAEMPAHLQRRLEGLRAVHNYSVRPNRPEGEAPAEDVVHPVVRTHPDTGRKAVYINPSYVKGIEGLSEEESRELMEATFQHCLQARYQLRYQWRVGDVVLWDNASVLHAATTLHLPPDQHRTLWRCIVSGGRPY